MPTAQTNYQIGSIAPEPISPIEPGSENRGDVEQETIKSLGNLDDNTIPSEEQENDRVETEITSIRPNNQGGPSSANDLTGLPVTEVPVVPQADPPTRHGDEIEEIFKESVATIGSSEPK